MHWDNGKFHKDITVGGTVYITDHKHVGIFGAKDYTQYGEPTVHSYLYGNDIGIVANNKFFADSNAGSNLWSKQYIHIEAGSTSANHGSSNGTGIEIISKNGPTLINSDSNAVNITAGTYINLNGGAGITINNSSYGTSLPSSGVEGRVFFKLIS